MISSAILIFMLTTASASPFPKVRSGIYGAKTKRSSDNIIKDCFHVTSSEGHYFYRASANDPTVCGFYIVAEPNQVIEIFFDHLDVPCNSGGLVAVVDGWELNGGYFPSISDHPLALEERVSEFCGLNAPSRVFITSQNAALIQYRVPKRSRGFSFKVNFLKNPSPCNILVEGLEDVYTLKVTKASNCSLMALYPVQVSLLSLNVGETIPGFNKRETGTMQKCQESGMKDYIEISGGDDLAVPKLQQADTFCGVDTYPSRQTTETVLCGVSTVKLVSSGEFVNTMIVKIRQANENDLLSASIICTQTGRSPNPCVTVEYRRIDNW